MRKALLFAIVATLLFSLAAAQPQSASPYARLKADAEREYAEKSFRRAHELYEQAAKLELSPEERRWVEFRLADTTLRADVAAPSDDPEPRNAARRALQELIVKSPDDELRADAHEALGDSYMLNRREHNPSAAQTHYMAALDYWAGSSDLARARRRYLDIVWKFANEQQLWNVPRSVLVNAVQIAETPEERARARYFLAQQYLRDGTPGGVERALELLEEILVAGKKSEYYDDALFHLAAGYGRGGTESDYPRALEYYRRLIAEFRAGESPYRDDAERAIAEILQPAVGVQAGGTYLPEAEQTVLLTWRNVKSIELKLYAVDLTKDARISHRNDWTETLYVENRTPLRRWTYETNDTGEHHPGQTNLRLEPKLGLGAYILTATSGTKVARQLVLVTDAHILVHQSQGAMDVHVSNVLTGEPLANARVRVSQQIDRERTTEFDVQADANGLARINIKSYGQVLITAAAGARQAFHATYAYASGREDAAQWRIYAFTDRPAYRPGETVQWKIIARTRENEQWRTPNGAELAYTINNPRGEKVSEGRAKLNAFGSFWAELPLTEAMPLGMYTINFEAPDARRQYRGSAQLFRLEEYKLPEFLVQVSTPEGKQYRLGDTIEATIDASYYFGGPVANATVEAVVHQQPFHRYWYPHRRYPWLYPEPPHYGGDTIVHRETLTTDATGRATLRIDTPRDGTDMTYRIEARVVDASRREVRGEGTVRVTRQRYTVMAVPEHYVHRPGDSVSVDFKAVDANDKPVVTTGEVKVFRRQWKKRHEDEEVLTTKLTTNAKGEATLTFTPRTTGHYVIRWTSSDGPRARDIVTAETAIWVTDRTTTDLGYHTGGLNLIVDKETLRAGETASVIIVTPASGRWVLLSTAVGAALETQVVRMDGTAKLVQFRVDEKHVPNFFIAASSIFNVELSTDLEQIVVPPVEQFLTVEVKTDREQYEPRQEGTVTITTRDADGKPVPAEVALAVTDEAVTAIQTDPAGDPRAFFFSDLRGNALQVTAGVHSQHYVRKEEAPKEEELQDDELALRREKGVMGGVVGRAAADSAMAPPPAPAPPPPPVMTAPAEAITVTAQAANVVATGAAAEGIEVQVRSDFRSTAFWKPDVITDASGTATVKVQYPEALTTWSAKARAVSAGAQVGMGSGSARTTMPLLVRLQAPRFFVEGDRVTVSAVINNNTNERLTVTPALVAEGLTAADTQPRAIEVAANGEARADFTVVAEKAGPAKLRVSARGSQYGDAMERAFVVYEHGIDKLIARSGKMRGDEALVRLDLPRERRATDLTVQVAPTLATTMLDALPYLIEFPYGCTEQTMSRFLPAAIVARTLEKLNLGRARIGDKDLDAVTRASIARLYDMQHGSGAWGWWKEGADDPWMTAYVIWGFAIARDGGIAVDRARVDRAEAWLERNLSEREKQYNDQAWFLHALSAWRATPSPNAQRAFDDTYANRERLTAYGRALLALTAHRWKSTERAKVLIRNLEDGVQIDRTPDQSILLKGETAAETMQTAHWGASGFWWRWYEGPVETTAFALQALVNIDPENRLVEPVMNWLVKNRRGTRWSNTRDTAIALLALNDYLQQSGELAGDVSYELSVNGKVIATKTITAAEVLSAPSRFTIDPAILRDTTQEVRIRRTSGKSPLYFAAEARFVSLEEPVKAAGNELFVRREYFRLAPRPTLLKGTQYDRIALRDRESIASGERIEVVVTIDAKNDYSYMLFEDLKPGGFEAVELQSGQSLHATQPKTNRTAWVHQELRDRKVALFMDRLPQGIWEIRYTLRAETPGSFHALPLLGQAFYVPEVRANGDEVRVTVTER